MLRLSVVLMLCVVFHVRCGALKKIGLIPNELEMATGLKAALEQGLFSGLDKFASGERSGLLKYAMPGELDKVDQLLNIAGVKTNLSALSNKITNAMAASAAASKPVFLAALKDMSFREASKLLITDNTHAATDYFKQATTATLISKLTPIIDSTVKLDNLDVEYQQIASVFNLIPFINKKLEPTASGFIAGRTLDVLFMMMANEETQIRQKYQLRKTDLLKKVFGYAEQELKKRLAK